jgi:hypothetical protein
MSPEERELLEKSVTLAEENNKLLHSMRRSQRLSTIARVLYWVLIIGISFGAFYFLQPYVDQLKGVYSGAEDVLNNFKKAN